LGFLFGQKQKVCEICPPTDVDFSLFWEAWNKLEEKYVDKEKLDTQEMIYGAVAGMVKSLEDPYTIFLKPDDTKRFIEDVKGTFEGVGMEIGFRDSQLRVIAPLEGTPAKEAGLKSGDRIMQVDGEPTMNMSVEEAVNKIRGPKGSEVILTIFREEWGETKDIKIIRGVIEIPSLKLEFKDDNIAHLHLYHFSEKASYDFSMAAIDILNSDTQKRRQCRPAFISRSGFGKRGLGFRSEGSSLKITIAKWLTPEGNLITDVGLEPDVNVEAGGEGDEDLQLDKAIEILKELN